MAAERKHVEGGSSIAYGSAENVADSFHRADSSVARRRFGRSDTSSFGGSVVHNGVVDYAICAANGFRANFKPQRVGGRRLQAHGPTNSSAGFLSGNLIPPRTPLAVLEERQFGARLWHCDEGPENGGFGVAATRRKPSSNYFVWDRFSMPYISIVPAQVGERLLDSCLITGS